MQVLADVGGKSFVGVNYCAMNKYKGPKTKEQWDTVVKNLKVGPAWKSTSLLMVDAWEQYFSHGTY